MFWESLVGGLKVLTHWESFIAGTVFVGLNLMPLLTANKLIWKSDFDLNLPSWVFSIIYPGIHAFSLSILILILSPIIFGLSDEAAWKLPLIYINFKVGSQYIFLSVLLFVAIILPYIPIIGQIPAMHTVIPGTMTLIFVLMIMENISQGAISEKVEFIPSLWILVGFIIVGGFLSGLGVTLTNLIIDKYDESTNIIPHIIKLSMTAIFDLIPLFMYGSWLGTQIKN